MTTLKVELKNGNVIESSGNKYSYGAEVTIKNSKGEILGHWDSEEWRDDPECVMGAILSCANGIPNSNLNIDFDQVSRALKNADWETDEYGKVRRVFIGTVFSLFPSGKYYTPFACSNVTEEEAALDEDWRELVNIECHKRGWVFENGEGDPCDCFIAEYTDADCGDGCNCLACLGK